MSDYPLGKIFLALVAILVIFKTTAVLMWTIIAGVSIWTIRLIDRHRPLIK